MLTPEHEREAREARETRETREAKHRRGQCCHEYVVGDTKYYCVEPFGHQCAHSYRPSMHEVERLAKRIADLERELEDARRDMTADQVRRALSARAARCGSQKALAAAIGVSQAFICDIINGRREPSGKPVAFLGLRRVVRYERRP